MGAADTVTKAYMKENTVFADAFNYLLYRGRAVVDPTQLQELDTTEIALPFGAQDEDGKPQEDAVQKYRDVLKSAVIKEDGEAAYILLGIENQTDIHYAMPVRNAVYDALQYGRQVADIAKKHRREDASSKAHSRGEYLSGFYKDDRLTPVITPPDTVPKSTAAAVIPATFLAIFPFLPGFGGSPEGTPGRYGLLFIPPPFSFPFKFPCSICSKLFIPFSYIIVISFRFPSI